MSIYCAHSKVRHRSCEATAGHDYLGVPVFLQSPAAAFQPSRRRFSQAASHLAAMQLRAGLPQHRENPSPGGGRRGLQPRGGPPQRHGDQARAGDAARHGGGRGWR